MVWHFRCETTKSRPRTSWRTMSLQNVVSNTFPICCCSTIRSWSPFSRALICRTSHWRRCHRLRRIHSIRTRRHTHSLAKRPFYWTIKRIKYEISHRPLARRFVDTRDGCKRSLISHINSLKIYSRKFGRVFCMKMHLINPHRKQCAPFDEPKNEGRKERNVYLVEFESCRRQQIISSGIRFSWSHTDGKHGATRVSAVCVGVFGTGAEGIKFHRNRVRDSISHFNNIRRSITTTTAAATQVRHDYMNICMDVTLCSVRLLFLRLLFADVVSADVGVCKTVATCYFRWI